MNFLTSKFFMMILPAILKSVSPVLVAQLRPLIDQLRETAKSTPNPWDDILIVLLEEILAGIISERD